MRCEKSANHILITDHLLNYFGIKSVYRNPVFIKLFRTTKKKKNILGGSQTLTIAIQLVVSKLEKEQGVSEL